LGTDQVKLDNLVFSINIDPSVRIQKLRRNECQVTLHPRPADLPALRQDGKLQVLQQPASTSATSPTTPSTRPSTASKCARPWTWR
jgi:ABC-type transport system substrate-binding protein